MEPSCNADISASVRTLSASLHVWDKTVIRSMPLLCVHVPVLFWLPVLSFLSTFILSLSSAPSCVLTHGRSFFLEAVLASNQESWFWRPLGNLHLKCFLPPHVECVFLILPQPFIWWFTPRSQNMPAFFQMVSPGNEVSACTPMYFQGNHSVSGSYWILLRIWRRLMKWISGPTSPTGQRLPHRC